MAFWDALKLLNKPQSILDGALLGFARQFPTLVGNDQGDPGAWERKSNQDYVKSMQDQGFDTKDLENALNLSKPGGNVNSILGGIKAGWKGDLSPSALQREAIKKDTGSYDNSRGTQGVGLLADVALDPLNALGGFAGKFGKVGEAATTYGKLGEGAGKAEKLAQFGRRFQQGMSVTGEPTMAAGSALLQGLAESKIAPRMRAIGQMLGKAPGNIEDVSLAEKAIHPVTEVVSDLPDVASIAKNTGVGSALDDVAQPSVEEELMRILQPKQPKVLIDPMIQNQDIISQILNNTGKYRG